MIAEPFGEHPLGREYDGFLARAAEEYNSNGKKTVLLAVDTYFPVFDGVVNVVDNYAQKLGDRCNILLLAPATKGKATLRGTPVVAVKSAYSEKLHYQVALPFFDPRAKRELARFRVDLVHAHSPFFLGHAALKFAEKRNIPFISTFHSQFRRDFERYVGDGFLLRFLMRYIMKVFSESREVWTMHAASEEILAGYGYRGKTVLLPNGTDFPPSPDYGRERAEERERLSVRGTCFIFAGRLVLQKNIFFLAEVLGELKERGTEFTMIFAGDGPDRPALEKKLCEEGVRERCVFAGNVTDKAALARLYAAADLFLFPSLYDVSSIVQIEAASRHTPAAFAEGSATSCTVTHGVNGLILPVEKNAFADGILAAVRGGILPALGENAFRDLYLPWDRAIERVAEEYRRLTEQKD